MKYLIDTHALIQFLEDNKKLPKDIKKIISNPDSDIYLSIVCLWEMSIKISLGKLKLSQSLEKLIEILEYQNITILTIDPAHVLGVMNLPFKHRDPFDRLMISQCLFEKMTFITNEALFEKYGVIRVW